MSAKDTLIPSTLINMDMTIRDLVDYARLFRKEVSVFGYPDGSVSVQIDKPQALSNTAETMPITSEDVEKVLLKQSKEENQE